MITLNTHAQNNESQNDWADLKKYSFENEHLGLPGKGENRVVFMGNSITEFWKTIDSNFFNNKQYIDRGISGQTTPQMLIRFRPDVIELKPSVVVILAGINDIAENTGPISLNNIFGNIVSMIELATINKITVVVSSVLPANVFTWRPQIKPAEKVIALNTMLSSYCKSHNIIYLDYYSKMVDDQEGLDKKYTEDGVHPTLAGYKIMEPLVEEAIKKALSKR
ncbi:MAG: SGNH/GDSL hydrolase family protein [Chitinophagaceae bacterium]